MVREKENCTGMRFGWLTVIGKGTTRHPYKKSGGKVTTEYWWLLRCDCGKEIELRRGDFDRPNGWRKSCGCARKRGWVDNKRRPKDITGERFGSLTAIRLTGNKDFENKPTWFLECDCGNKREMSLSHLQRNIKKTKNFNCGDKENHPEKFLQYPPMPSPIPNTVKTLLEKYISLTKLDYTNIKQHVEDERIDRLLRVCWIIEYRRSQGKEISELHEKRLVKKHLRYANIDAHRKINNDIYAGKCYTQKVNNKNDIGIRMTKLTSNDYPNLELRGEKVLPKKLKFKRK